MNMGKKIAEALKNQESEADSFDSLSMEEMRDLIRLDSEEDIIPKIEIEEEEPLTVRAQIKLLRKPKKPKRTLLKIQTLKKFQLMFLQLRKKKLRF